MRPFKRLFRSLCPFCENKGLLLKEFGSCLLRVYLLEPPSVHTINASRKQRKTKWAWGEASYLKKFCLVNKMTLPVSEGHCRPLKSKCPERSTARPGPLVSIRCGSRLLCSVTEANVSALSSVTEMDASMKYFFAKCHNTQSLVFYILFDNDCRNLHDDTYSFIQLKPT